MKPNVSPGDSSPPTTTNSPNSSTISPTPEAIDAMAQRTYETGREELRQKTPHLLWMYPEWRHLRERSRDTFRKVVADDLARKDALRQGVSGHEDIPT